MVAILEAARSLPINFMDLDVERQIENELDDMILSVFEASSKTTSVEGTEDDIKVFSHQSGQSQIAIVVAVVRGVGANPSFYFG